MSDEDSRVANRIANWFIGIGVLVFIAIGIAACVESQQPPEGVGCVYDPRTGEEAGCLYYE